MHTCLFFLSSLSACALSALSLSPSILPLTSSAASDLAASNAASASLVSPLSLDSNSPSCRRSSDSWRASLSCEQKC